MLYIMSSVCQQLFIVFTCVYVCTCTSKICTQLPAYTCIQETALREAALRGHTAVVEMLAKIQASEKEAEKVQKCNQSYKFLDA